MGRSAPTVALLGLVLVACGGQDQSGSTAREVRSLSGVDVVIESDAPFTRAADFDARFESTIQAALQYWGGTWALLDRRRTFRIVDAPSVACGGRESLGCVDGSEVRFTTRDPALGTFACLEQTVLVHEIGHVVLGDPNHLDPRWMEMDELATELGGRVGYTVGGDAPCTPYVSVWRHPIGSP